MKFDWGKGILIVIILFLGACAAFIIYSRSVTWSLVEDDYYPKELRHEEVLIKKRNFNALAQPMEFQMTRGALNITFPPFFKGKLLTGHIQVYRPSDPNMDYLVPVAVDTSLVQTIPESKLKHGKYVIKVDWASSGTSYYKEYELFVP